jgi:hypothetical protein
MNAEPLSRNARVQVVAVIGSICNSMAFQGHALGVVRLLLL